MIYDLTRIAYDLILLLPNGERLMLMDVCEKLGWEENAGEIAARLNVTLRDLDGALHKKIPLGAQGTLIADYGEGAKEVFRGTVWDIGFSGAPGGEVALTLYDPLYYLNKSQVNKYYAKGMKTKAILTGLLKEWNVPVGRYDGLDVAHGKLLFKGKTIAQIVKDVLKDAEEKGAERCFLRAREGKVDILPCGANETVLIMRGDENVLALSDRYDMTGMVTRVVITGKEDKKGRPKVSYAMDGKTEYGVLQKIVEIGGGTLAEAKARAGKILKENGQPERSTILTCADMPALRKGDRVYACAGALNGYVTVEGVSHDAKKRTMRVEVRPV